MKLKAKKVGSAKQFTSSLKKSSGGANYMKRVKDDEPMVVRFLLEPPDWIEYWEHFTEKDKFFPDYEGLDPDTLGIDEKTGKTKRPSKRYLTLVIDVEEGAVTPLVLPTSAAKQLDRYYNKYKTVLDRDYEISREGKGYETEYHVIGETPTKINTAKYQKDMPDLMDVLMSALPNGDNDEDDGEDDLPDDDAPISRTRRRPSRRVEEEEGEKPIRRRPRPSSRRTEPDEDDDVPTRTVRKRPLGSSTKTPPKRRPLRR